MPRPLYVPLLLALLSGTAAAQNQPPASVGVADGDVFDITIDDRRTISFSFQSPEAGQTTTVTVDDIDGAIDAVRTTPGNVATVEIDLLVFGGLGADRDYAFEVTATDDGTPAESTVLRLTASASNPPAVACSPTAPLNLETFVANGGPDPNALDAYFTLYVPGPTSTPVDMRPCTAVVFDETGTVTDVDGFTETLGPFTDNQFFYPNRAFSPDGGGFAVVQGASASVGDTVDDVLAANVFVLGAVYGPSGQDELSNKNDPDPAARRAAFETALQSRLPNRPPVPIGIADGDRIPITVGVETTIAFSFASPEPGQTTAITVDDVDLVVKATRLTAGNVATAEIDLLVGTGAFQARDYALRITATDDGTTSEATTIEVVVEASDPPAVACSPAARLNLFPDPGYATGSDEQLSFFVSEQGGVDMSGCTLVGFDAQGVAVSTFAPTDVLSGSQDTIYDNDPNAPGDTVLPLPLDTFVDGTGAFALVRGSVAIGDDLARVLATSEFVLGGVYDASKEEAFSHQTILSPAARRAAFIASAETCLALDLTDDEAPVCSATFVDPATGRGVVTAFDNVGIVRASFETLTNLTGFVSYDLTAGVGPNGRVFQIAQAGPFAQGDVFDLPEINRDVDLIGEIADLTVPTAAFGIRVEDAAGNQTLCEASYATPVQTTTCSRAADLAFGDIDTDGNDPTYGELATVVNDSNARVDLTTCSFATLDPQSETVVYTATATGAVGPIGAYRFATSAGDQPIPAGSIPDGPGALVLIEGTTSVGATVQDVLPNVVAGLVYRTEDDVYAAMRGGAAPAQRDAFLAAFGRAVASGDDPDGAELALAVVPNPLRGRARVSFALAEAGEVRVSVYDALGRQVARLADAAYGAGRHELALEGLDVPAGAYVVRVVAGDATDMTRVTVVH